MSEDKMNSLPIPVRIVGPGSHVEEEMQYLDMPRDMRTFEMPRVPERDVARRVICAKPISEYWAE
jgi:hypothetical protein